MYVDLKTILKIVEGRNCTIPAFNVYNMESVLEVMDVTKETGASVIFQMYNQLFDHQNARCVAPMILETMQELDTPAAFHLDHGAGTAEVLKALHYRVTGIMIDALVFPLEENTEATRSVMEMCGACGISVEGELGHMGTVRDVSMSEYTDVEGAEQFVRETDMAALVIVAGTAHGRYKRAPVPDIGRIGDIKAATGIPLILHGGSGVPDRQVSMAVEAGIQKVNFGTDLCYSSLSQVFEVDRSTYALDLFMEEPIQAVKGFAISKIRLLGADIK